MQYISGKPTLRLRQFLPKQRGTLDIFPFNHRGCCYFFSSRYALAAAIKALGLKIGDEVLIPSYNCGTEIDPFLRAKISLVYYRIKRDLSIDFDDLLSKIDNNIKAILVTHFLGFPQPIDEIKQVCVQNKILLIEDCAHALLSNYNGQPLGSFGDAAFFSILKTLPIPNGGVLVFGNDSFGYSQNSETPNIFSTLFYAALLLRQRSYNDERVITEYLLRIVNNGLFLTAESLKIILSVFKKIFKTGAHNFVRPDSYSFIEELADWGMSSLSMNIMKNVDLERIRDIRQRNFNYLLQRVLAYNNIHLPFRRLPDGGCPLFFPIILESPEQRENFYLRLRARGIVTHCWWNRFHPDVAWKEFPDAVFLKQRLFGLPIHQDLTLLHLDRMCNDFETLLSS